MAVDFREAQPPASLETIATVESALNIRLPEDYRRFLQHYNGGYLHENFLPPDGEASARYLYSAGPNDDEDIGDLESKAHEYSSEEPRNDHVLRPGFLPIGEDDGSNILLLSMSGDDSGAVYFYFHDVPEELGAYIRVADSFEEFFERLRPAEEMDLTT